MKASLIFATYNKSPRLAITLKSLTILDSRYLIELIIVNDGSTDETDSILNEFLKVNKLKFKVKILNIKNSGRSIARNLGAQEAQGDILIFIDDDVILTPDFVNKHIEAHTLEDKDIVVRGCILELPYLKFFKDPITGEMFDEQMKQRKTLLEKRITLDMIEPSLIDILKQTKVSKFEQDIQNLYKETCKKSMSRWIGCNGGNFSAKQKTFDNVGGFDVNLGKEWGCEDLELGYRLKKFGCDFIFESKALNIHISHMRKNHEEQHRRAFSYFMKKHKAEELKVLNEYFEGNINSLVLWKDLVLKQSGEDYVL